MCVFLCVHCTITFNKYYVETENIILKVTSQKQGKLVATGRKAVCLALMKGNSNTSNESRSRKEQ